MSSSESASESASQSASTSASEAVTPGGGETDPTDPAGDETTPAVDVAVVAPVVAAAPAPVMEAEVQTLVAAPAVAPVAPVIEVEDEEVPLAVVDLEDDIEMEDDEATGDQELMEVEDEEVPLTNTSIVESVQHCITHYVGLIIAAVLSAFYVGSAKKQKKEITGLEKELDEKERR